MQTTESQQIAARFFQGVEHLIESKQIRGVQTFTRRYEINRRNFQRSEKEPQSNIFQICWLMYLVRDYGFSARWLLLGEGEMIKEKKHDQKTAPYRILEKS